MGEGVVVVIGLVSAACGAGDRATEVAWQAVTDTVGDTVVVRTVSGSVWGESAELVEEVRIGVFEGEEAYMLGDVAGFAVASDGSVYLYDRQVPALRKYAPDGTYVATFGREGGGPGEYRNSDGGLAVLPDGTVILRDPGNARMQRYSADGEPLGSWPIQGGWFTSQRLFTDTAGHVLNRAAIDMEQPFGERRAALVRYTADGTAVDTLLAPDYPYEAPRIRAERAVGDSRSVSISTVPFVPTESWTYSPLGYTIGWVTTGYAIDLFGNDGVLRIARDYVPVEVKAGEREEVERRAVASMRRTDPEWKWNAGSIPGTKPPFRTVHVGAEGRLWVVLHTEAREVEVEERESDRPGALPPQRWHEPTVFDVFEPDGRYLGRVHAPEGFSQSPAPVFRGDSVWAVVRDEFDVEYLVRFRVERVGDRV